jgi:hypothetical protein
LLLLMLRLWLLPSVHALPGSDSDSDSDRDILRATLHLF